MQKERSLKFENLIEYVRSMQSELSDSLKINDFSGRSSSLVR